MEAFYPLLNNSEPWLISGGKGHLKSQLAGKQEPKQNKNLTRKQDPPPPPITFTLA